MSGVRKCPKGACLNPHRIGIIALKRGGVDEHVLLAVVRLDEAEAFLIVVEFNSAVRHRGSLSFAYARGMWRTIVVAIVPFRRFWREAEACARK